MADVVVTAANVVLNSGPSAVGILGETVTAGQVVYLKSDGKWWLAQRDGATGLVGFEQAGAGAAGTTLPAFTGYLAFALNGGGAGQPVKVALPGADVTCGGTVAVGTVYTLSATAGGFTSDASASTNYNSIVGVGKSTSRLRLILVAAEAAVA